MIVRTLLGVLGVVAALEASHAAGPPDLSCHVCSVPNALRDGKDKFSIIVIATTGERGALTRIQVMTKTPPGVAESIRGSWRIEGMEPGTGVNVLLDYKAGAWTRIYIMAGRHTYDLGLLPEKRRI